MKQINDLIICEIPKGADNIRIETILGSPVFKYDYTLDGFVPLPLGCEYEVIGTESKFTGNVFTACEAAAGRQLGLTEVIRPHWERHTTDLLFIKRIKK